MMEKLMILLHIVLAVAGIVLMVLMFAGLITGIVGGHTQGQRLGSADLTLTGPSSKTII